MALRLSKNSIVLAIYGPSCVGKSTLAHELTRQWGVPVRHCGNVVKASATAIGVSPNFLPLELHREIDAETRRLAKLNAGHFVIEGTYLDAVLTEMPQVKFLQLVCDETMRATRFLAKASSQTTSSVTLRDRDEEDNRLRRILYGNRPSVKDWMVLDTTHLAPDKMVSAILARLQKELRND